MALVMRDYRKLAAALLPALPPEEVNRVIAPLDSLEVAFRPIAERIPHETEPAVQFVPPPEDAR